MMKCPAPTDLSKAPVKPIFCFVGLSEAKPNAFVGLSASTQPTNLNTTDATGHDIMPVKPIFCFVGFRASTQPTNLNFSLFFSKP